MVADRITVGVYALDHVVLPRSATARGWAARLAEAEPVLADAAEPCLLEICADETGWALATRVDLGGARHHAGTKIAVEPVEARPGLFLVRAGGKAVALASAPVWSPGQAHPSEGAERPETLAAYARGTLIDTPDGPRLVEDLRPGEVVTTLANGSRPLRWVGRRQVAPVELLAHPGLCPVEFVAGAIGNDRALLVSPQQRILIDDWRAEVYFGEDRVLVAAQALVDDQAARVVLPTGGIDYVSLLCDRHEVLLAEGALSESFHPGEAGLAMLGRSERDEVCALFAEADLLRRRPAFPIVRHAEARALRLRS